MSVCGKKMGRRSKGDTMSWNDEVKKAVSREKDAQEVMCLNSSEDNKRRYEE